ncbi:hypothetical protein SAMN04487904_10547 [Actinopolyspora lacussalsi subsp. righensis]|uniref:Uncharacterized protein n=1 Tax=Actinopolyspora righensis TaxID=995060 RepID=A0A1I6ZQ72_9ACTN|nr:hypothetical protein SAMN04487904_10547 [Actinopolyspora righensis]
MTIPEVSAPCQQTVGATARRFRAGSGFEPTDPDKVGELLLKLASLDEPPVRLLLGSDAVRYSAVEDAR